jgi:hypothetical protein
MCGYVVSVGGDYMGMGRFLIPALPFSALVFALMVQALFAERRFPAVLRWSALLIPLLSLPPAFASGHGIVPFAVIERLHFRWDFPPMTELRIWRDTKTATKMRSAKGRALARIAKPGDSVVLGAMGATGYYSGLKVYDRTGLVTPEVMPEEGEEVPHSPGHWKTVRPKFFLKHRPTFVDPLIVSPQGTENSQRPFAPAGYIWKEFPLLPEEGMPEGTILRVLCRVDQDAPGATLP